MSIKHFTYISKFMDFPEQGKINWMHNHDFHEALFLNCENQDIWVSGSGLCSK